MSMKRHPMTFVLGKTAADEGSDCCDLLSHASPQVSPYVPNAAPCCGTLRSEGLESLRTWGSVETPEATSLQWLVTLAPSRLRRAAPPCLKV